MNNQGLPQSTEPVKCEVRSCGEYLSLGMGRDALRRPVSVLTVEICFKEGSVLKDTLLTKGRADRA